MWIKSRGIVIVYKPNIFDMTQHPWFLNSLSSTPAFAAADVPPERNLCNENSSLSMTTAVMTTRKKLSRSCIWQWNILLSQCRVFIIFMTSYWSEYEFFGILIYSCYVKISLWRRYWTQFRIAPCYKLTTYSFTISKMESKIGFISTSIYEMLIPNRLIDLFI